MTYDIFSEMYIVKDVEYYIYDFPPITFYRWLYWRFDYQQAN